MKDLIRWRSDHACAIDFLRIPKEDLLAYEFHASKVFHPSYYVALDRATNSIVLAIRGTMVSRHFFFTTLIMVVNDIFVLTSGPMMST